MGNMERQRQMTVGPAGTVNTNVPPQNYGGVSQEQVEGFKEAVSHSTTSSNASGTQSSKGEHTPEHSQDTSKSFPFVLATRPPINLGNPTGKQGTPLYDTQGKGSKAGSETKAPSPMTTSKYETRGLPGELDPKYDDKAWKDDDSRDSRDKVQISPTGDKRLENLARSAANKALSQNEMDGGKADVMVQGSDGKNYRLSVRRSGNDTSVEITAMQRASDGKDVATMTHEMNAKGITIGDGFSKDELAAVYDGFATMKGKDLDAMNGVTLEKGTRGQWKGTDAKEMAHYGDKKITFFKEAFEPGGMVGNMPRGGATFLHEAGHRFEEFSGSLNKFQQTKGHADDITPYDAGSEKLSREVTGNNLKVDPKKEHYAEAYMLYKSDPKFMEQNYPQLFQFFKAQTTT
jgi:hypothetical protein